MAGEINEPEQANPAVSAGKTDRNGKNGSQPLYLPTNGHGDPGVLADGKLFDVAITRPATIVKRDGRVVPFDARMIEIAITKCFNSLGRRPSTPINELTRQAVNIIAVRYEQPHVEEVQDIVEMVLQAAGEYEAAKHYILYRAEHAKLRKERPVPEAVRARFAESDAYFPTQLQKFQFYDKYSRFNYDLGRRETWVETVDRALNFLYELAGDRLPGETYARLRRGILEMRAMPSMRLLAMAGPAARRNHMAIYNCSYLPVESIDAFVEALAISMSGCGVGFSVERRYVEQFPRVRRQTGRQAGVYLVEDSAEGWADALRTGLQTWFDGADIRFDLSLVRPAGAPLRTKGGRASGPEPLRKMLDFARSRILARQGSFLRPLDAHDLMCAVGGAAVSGGMRRTAMISLFDFEDQEMRHSKDGDFDLANNQRWNANNSAVWPDGGLTQVEVARYMLDVVESQRGEPGIFSRRAAISTRPERRQLAEFGTNPCVTGDTWVLTDRGPRRVIDLLNVPHHTIVNGQPYRSHGFWETGIKPVLRLKTKEGFTLRLTGNHRVLAVPLGSGDIERPEWVEAGRLRPGDQIKLHNHRNYDWLGQGSFAEGRSLGVQAGGGTSDPRSAAPVFGRELGQQGACRAANTQGAGLRDFAVEYAGTITPPVEQTSSAFHRGFLQGLFDADGVVIGAQTQGVSVRLARPDVDLLHAAQRMLLRLGIVATVHEDSRPSTPRLAPEDHAGYRKYQAPGGHELVIANDNVAVFAKRVGSGDPEKLQRLKGLAGYLPSGAPECFAVTVESVEPDTEEMVYDCSVPDTGAFDANGLYVHNCGEIVLRPFEFCNLSIAVARAGDTYESLKDKVEMAAVIGTIQAMATHFPGLRPIWRQNCEEERLLGVDINGQLDSCLAQDPDVQEQLRAVAIEVNRTTAMALGINQSASVTCVKPSGNSSQLLNCSPGIHTRWAPYYVRNVRVGAHTPVFKVLRDAGVPMDPENGQTPETADTWVVHFPVKAPEGAITRKDRTALQQCEYWLQNKQRWTEHNPSVTITYHPDEVLDLVKWIWEHQDIIGGMAFLPGFDAQYAQMPYEEIGQEEYERRAAEFPEIDFSKIYRYEEEDFTKAAQELACMAGVCEIER